MRAPEGFSGWLPYSLFGPLRICCDNQASGSDNCSTEGAWPETICDVSSEQLGESAVMDRDVRDFDLLGNSVQQEGECFHVGALTTCALPSVWG